MENKILVETSARHVHVTQETLEILFGKGHELSVRKMLSQPGQYASTDKVTVLGYNKKDPNGPRPSAALSILGPVRKANQVELSFTDARSLGISAPVRESGDIAGSGRCTLKGPAGEVDLEEGVIIAKRHIHMTPEDAEATSSRSTSRAKAVARPSLGTPSSAFPPRLPSRCTSTPTNATPPRPSAKSTASSASSTAIAMTNAAVAGKKTIAAAAKGNNGEGIRFPPERRLLPGDAHRLR